MSLPITFIELDEEGNVVSMPIPDNWMVEVKSVSWEAWAHSYDKEVGVLAVGSTKREALTNLKIRMEDWLRQANK